MSVHFILDGYNIINQAGFLKSHSLKGAREKLLKFIETCRPQGSPNNKVTIVFDGNPQVFSLESHQIPKVIFSKGEDADSCIKSIVEKSANPKAIIVVSDDKALKFSVRSSGAKVLSVKELFLKGKIKNSNDLEKDDSLSFYKADKITSELKKLWLKD